MQFACHFSRFFFHSTPIMDQDDTAMDVAADASTSTASAAAGAAAAAAAAAASATAASADSMAVDDKAAKQFEIPW